MHPKIQVPVFSRGPLSIFRLLSDITVWEGDEDLVVVVASIAPPVELADAEAGAGVVVVAAAPAAAEDGATEVVVEVPAVASALLVLVEDVAGFEGGAAAAVAAAAAPGASACSCAGTLERGKLGKLIN